MSPIRIVSGLLALLGLIPPGNAQTSIDLTGTDIGAVAAAGSFTSGSGSYTVRGSGADIWGASDEFHFAYRTLDGDGEIIARVSSVTAAGSWTKAGVMLRETLAANARFAFMMVTPGNGAAFQYRTTAGGLAAPSGSGDIVTVAPYWVRVKREGTLIRGYLSADGVTWTQRSTVTLSSLANSVYVGLAVTSHADGTLATATFTNLSISGTATPADTTPPTVPQNLAATANSSSSIALAWNASTDSGGSGLAGYRVYRNGGSTPIASVTTTSYLDTTVAPNTSYTYTVTAFDGAGNQSLPSAAASATTLPSSVSFTGTDIGSVAAAGSFTTSSDTYTVRGSGADIWSTSDEFFFVYRALDGDGEIVARVASVSNTNPWTKAGVMLRETLAANSRYAFMLVTPGQGADFQYRTTVGGAAGPGGTADVTTVAPHWVRVKREGTLVRGFLSADGVVWTQRSSVTLSGLASSVNVGLALTSHADGSVATASFQNVSVIQGGQNPDTIAPTVPQNVVATAASSTSISVTWSASTDSGGSGLAGYRVFRNGTQVGGQIAATQFTDTSLTPSTAYVYTVRAVDNAGNVSALSASSSATTLADTAAPSAPANLRSTGVMTTSVALAWNASTDTGGSGVAGYRVYRNGTQVGAQTTSLQLTDSGLIAATSYSYVVRAIDNAGNLSANSNTLSVTTSSGAQSGLDSRPNNASCLAPNQPDLGTSVALTRVFPNLTFTRPLLMLQAPGDNSRWYVVQQTGVVRMFDNINTTTTTSNYIDIQDRVNDDASEAGLLGMAFDPAYATNGRVYLSYTANPGSAGSVLQSRISRFIASGGVLTPSSEAILLTIPQPFDNHNGGNIAFGPDGLLYAGFGDGGSGGDPQNNAQNRSTLLGKLIRIDVRGASGYTIPSNNPYAGGAQCSAGTAAGSALCPEIYAYGLRNPWRWSFDRAAATPELWLADVGQGAWEEVDRIERGGNYGWRFREGAHCFNPSSNCPTTANGAPLIDPVAEYSHNTGVSITGGYVYRGTAIGSLAGRYVFGDFSTGRIFALIPNASGALQLVTILESGRAISSFAQGNDGELYVIDYFTGGLYKLVPGTGTPANTIPQLLSQTGCFDPADPAQPLTALIPFAPNAPFWSDGADKTRWMALPNSTRITVQTDGDWTFPNGTVLAKHFRLNGQLIETRLFMRHADTGNWAGYTYRWDAAQTDATLVSGGLVTTVQSQPWTYPSEAQCVQCHTSAAGRSLGLETSQLNGNLTYPATGRTANQLTTLDSIGMFSAPLTMLPAYANPFDTSRPVAERARAYLHTNCAQCHRPSGGTPVNMDLRYATAIASSNTCNQTPSSGDLGVSGARIILPGDATRSVLYLRMNRRDANQMPPVGSHAVDTQGAALLRQWIDGMSSNCQ